MKRENHSLKKENRRKKTTASPNGLQAENEERKPVLPSPPPHRSPEQKEFSPCRPLLAQTSTTPHTEAHRHRGRRSCAWSLETYRSRREPRCKGLFFMIFPFPLFGFRIIDGFFLFSGFMGFFGAAWILLCLCVVFVFWFLMVVVDDVAGYGLDCCLVWSWLECYENEVHTNNSNWFSKFSLYVDNMNCIIYIDN